MKQFIKILALFTGILLVNSCITPRPSKRIIPDNEKNPTEYLFNIPMKRIKWVIEATFEEQQFCGYYLRNYEKYGWDDIPNLEKNENDYFLRHLSGNEFLKCRSKVYFSKSDKPRLYVPFCYFIHLEETETGTKVYVYAIYPKLRVGWRCGAIRGNIINFGVVERYIPVPSTTVEEYEILLMIGRTLGIEKDMPPLKIPKKIVVSSIF